MICPSCKAGEHGPPVGGVLAGCPGGTWCDCQHAYGRVAAITPDGQSSGTRVLLGVLGPPDADGNRTGVVYPAGTFHSEPEPEE